jgi:hypothetical protein
MTSIRATCPGCGDVRLRAGELTVRVCADNGTGSYCFRCPACGRRVSRNASARIVELLASSGVRLERWSHPAELREGRSGPPFTPDDLLDFHQLLQRSDWFDLLAHGVGPPSSS